MLKLAAFSKIRSSDLETLRADKMPHNAPYAIAAAHIVLEQRKTPFNLIYCTGEGEIIQTYEFYKNMANSERARPLVFQNSLHNATLGALSLALSSVSSGQTISSGDLSFEMALDLALTSSSDLPLLIVAADVYDGTTLEIRKKAYGPKITLESGACAGLFIPERCPQFAQGPGPVIADIKIKKLKISGMGNEYASSSYFPSNGLEDIYCRLKSTGTIQYERPNNHLIEVSFYEN